MFCAECGLEIKGKNFYNKGDALCGDCHERQTKKAVLHKNVEAIALQNQVVGTIDTTVPLQGAGTVSRTDNPFSSEDSYAEHVNALRTKLFMPKIIWVTVLSFLLIVGTPLFSEALFSLIFVLTLIISLTVIYFRFFNHAPNYENLVIVKGIMKRRVFRSKNDDRSYRLTAMTNIKNSQLLKTTKSSEVYLRGISKQVNPYLDQNITYYIDAKLQMILACKNDN